MRKYKIVEEETIIKEHKKVTSVICDNCKGEIIFTEDRWQNLKSVRENYSITESIYYPEGGYRNHYDACSTECLLGIISKITERNYFDDITIEQYNIKPEKLRYEELGEREKENEQ
jgi:hypothetical protein